MVIKFTLFDAIMSNKLKFEIKNVPESATVKRIGFGRAPVNFPNENRCWTIRNCYFSENDILVMESVLGYKIYKKN